MLRKLNGSKEALSKDNKSMNAFKKIGFRYVLRNRIFLSFYQILDTVKSRAVDCTEVCFASFLSGGFITAIVVNPPERKLAKRTSVDWSTIQV